MCCVMPVFHGPERRSCCRANGASSGAGGLPVPDWGIVVEVSGQLGHAAPPDRTRDAQRRNELQDIGHLVYEYTWGDVTARPAYVAETMRERLIRAGWVPGSIEVG